MNRITKIWIFIVGPPCVVKCKTGYTLDPATSPEYRCNENKEWIGSVKCKRKKVMNITATKCDYMLIAVTCPPLIEDLKQDRIDYVDGSRCRNTEFVFVKFMSHS